MGRGYLLVDVCTNQPTPIDLAMEVIVRVEDREYPAGAFASPAGTGGCLCPARFRVAGVGAGDPTVMLRSNRELARRSVRLNKVWLGEVEFGPFELVARHWP
jgi:hypothetical protein